MPIKMSVQSAHSCEEIMEILIGFLANSEIGELISLSWLSVKHT